MAGRARAASATGVLERDPEVHRHVQKRLGQTVMAVFELAVRELDGLLLAVDDEGDFRHS